LQFGENYFVTGDYVVAGVGLRGLGNGGYATQQFTMPDKNSVPSTGVPAGAQIVAAILYWQTVESSQTAFVGQHGFFRPVFTGGPATGYPITGVLLGNPNAPTSWSSGGCSGSSQGSKTIRTYRADVRPFLPQDSNGNIQANGTYEVSLADSGSGGGGTPLTLGASLIIIYRAITPALPLNSVVIYDGAAAPSNASSAMSQTIQGFYQAATNPISKLTHIVGNGKANKNETVSLNGVPLPSLYGSLPPFPGNYGGGSWDEPTWSFPNPMTNPIKANASSATTVVSPSATNAGCVSWGVIIVGTTVQDSDNDGLIDSWKADQGYCDASINGGTCNKGDLTDPGWVPLPGATKNEKDLFAEIDYMCSMVNPDGTCDTTGLNYSFYPPQAALDDITSAFLADSSGTYVHGIHVHFIKGNAIQEQTCADTVDSSGNPVLCPYLGQPGVVTWKAGLEFLKTQPLNKNPDGTTWTETECEQNPATCVRRFQHGRKDSYHYALFAHALGLPQWGFQDGSLINVAAAGTTVTLTTKTPHGLLAGDRVTIADAISNPGLNGTYKVQSVLNANSFTITTSTTASATYTSLTDPRLSVALGQAGTGSGFSDIGGADSLVTLGLWGPVGQTVNVQAGTLMHEMGHSIGLTHGGFYYDTPGSYLPTFEPNCKPNYQSVMSYLFQVDLLDNGLPDYSEQSLSPLDETSLPGGITTTDASALAYPSTKWYTPTAPHGVGTPATHHCDGTPKSPGTDPDPTMFRVAGPANPITPQWVNDSDINFNGALDKNLRGYNDWAHVDLRLIGGTASDISSPGFGSLGAGFGSLGAGFGSLGAGFGSLGAGFGSLGAGFGSLGAGFGSLGAGFGDISFETANSVTRPPRDLMANLATKPPSIVLNWRVPTFGRIGAYNIYRSANGAPFVPIASVPGSSLTYTDRSISCGSTYSYLVTAVLANTNQESVASNTTPPLGCH
jgi:hypothetical protein